jgi:hypothetical protein
VLAGSLKHFRGHTSICADDKDCVLSLDLQRLRKVSEQLLLHVEILAEQLRS